MGMRSETEASRMTLGFLVSITGRRELPLAELGRLWVKQALGAGQVFGSWRVRVFVLQTCVSLWSRGDRCGWSVYVPAPQMDGI